MDWGISRILWVATVVPVFFVFVTALGVAVHCTQKKVRPLAAWLLALAWAGVAFAYFLTVVGHFYLMRAFSMDFAGALTMGTEALMLVCGIVMVAAIAAFKPLEPSAAQGKEAGHGV